MHQSQRQESQQQRQGKGSRHTPDHVMRTPIPPDIDRPVPADREPADQTIDDGRTIHGGESESVRPERNVETPDHGVEDVFDADNRGQR